MPRHRSSGRDPAVDRLLAESERGAAARAGASEVSFRIAVGELTASRADLVLASELADILYSDPPWGPGNLMYWRTMNDQRRRPSWPEFLTLFCGVVRASIRPGGHVFVEMGMRWVDELAAAMAAVGITETARWKVRYGQPPRPNVLWYSGPGSIPDPSGMGGEAMTTHVLEAVAAPGALVFDPCCGKGMTARCAFRAGMRFAGVELNPDRAAVTRAWCARWQASRTAR